MNSPIHKFGFVDTSDDSKIQIDSSLEKVTPNFGMCLYDWIIITILGTAWVNAIYILL